MRRPKEARRADVTYDDIGGMGDDHRPAARDGRAAAALPRDCSSGSASIRPRACCSTARPAPARPGSRARSPTRATPNSSTSTAPRSWARPMARARSKLREVFEEAAKAAPSIVFIDEIDFDRAQARPGDGRGREAARRAVAHPDGRAGGARQSRRHRRDQPARGDRRGAEPARPVRPRDRRRRARRARPARDPRHPHPRHAARRPASISASWRGTTYGFVGADLAALAREAAIEAVRKIMPRLNLDERTIPPEVLDTLASRARISSMR